MKLTQINIRGYKSIGELDFPIQKYGDSYTTILLGKNESGKSNVLDAMATPTLQESKEEVDFIKIKNQQKEPPYVQVFFSFELEEDDDYRSYIAKNLSLPDSLLSEIQISSIDKEIYLSGNSNNYKVDLLYDYKKLSLKKYSFTTEKQVIPASPNESQKTISKSFIKLNSDIPDESKELYKPLEKELFEEYIKEALMPFVENITIPIDIWKSEDKYLIKDKINLKDFAKSTDINLPLKNMFYLADYDSTQKISQVIKEIEKDGNKRKNLRKILSKKTTQYINDKWEEHRISIDVDIESDLSASVTVQDKSDDDHYFDMSDRSQGFKQFISLLLSISISSASGDTKDHLILIDEPEVHLHPSGIRFMLKELLEIGKHNYLFISTHSNFMLDRNTKLRHYLLSKDRKNLTVANQVKTDDDINDDEVLQSAFGINVISDYLSPSKLLVEGETDKKILIAALNLLEKDHGILITNGTGSNIVATASLLAYHKVIPVVLTDDDVAGKKSLENIKKISKSYASNVFTIRDLEGGIVSDGTIEDVLPLNFVQANSQKLFTKHGYNNFTFSKSSPICEQLKSHLNSEISDQKSKKQLIDAHMSEFKNQLADAYNPTKIKLEQEAPLLKRLAEQLLQKFNTN